MSNAALEVLEKTKDVKHTGGTKKRNTGRSKMKYCRNQELESVIN